MLGRSFASVFFLDKALPLRYYIYERNTPKTKRVTGKEENDIGLFSKKPTGREALPKAVAFVDYEHWYVSYLKNFGLRPDIGGWFDMLSQSVYLTEAFFFADFSHKSLSDEIRRIRPYSNKIIDTRNTNGATAKDYTDFIILDNMYQKAVASDEIDVYILFTGDGHFSSVCSFIKNVKGKEMWVYGVRNSFSRQLQDTASRSVTLPSLEELKKRNTKLVLDEIAASETQVGKSPTTKKLISDIAERQKIPPDDVRAAIAELTEKKYLTERVITMRSAEKKTVLFVDWDSLRDEGVYEKAPVVIPAPKK